MRARKIQCEEAVLGDERNGAVLKHKILFGISPDSQEVPQTTGLSHSKGGVNCSSVSCVFFRQRIDSRLQLFKLCIKSI